LKLLIKTVKIKQKVFSVFRPLLKLLKMKLHLSLLAVVCARPEKRIPIELRLPSPLRDATGKPTDVSCPCPQDLTLCNPVTSQPDREIFGFGSEGWNVSTGFDFDTISTIAWGEGGGELICKAHANNVRVVASANPPLTGNQTDIDAFIADTLLSVQQGFFDGITFDYESPVSGYDDPLNAIYVDVIDQTTKALKAVNPNFQTSVCAAWSPLGIDGRFYDYNSLAAVTDFLYIMCYDTRSQVFYQCVASANAPLSICQKGVQDFINLGIPASKLVLGIPWYGYDYPCEGEMSLDDKLCNLKITPFRGVNCSDAAGGEVTYAGAMNLINGGNEAATVGEVWRDSYMNVQFFNYELEGKMHQFWFDDAVSLGPIYRYVKEMNLRGTGPFTFSQIDNDPDMWEALKLAL